MECLSGYRKNRNGTCVKNCRPDQVLSAKTDRCVVQKSQFPSRLSKTFKKLQKQLLMTSGKKCPSGYIKNKIGRCSKDCRADQYRDPLTDRCKVRERPNYYARKKQNVLGTKRFFRPTSERTKYTRRYYTNPTRNNNNLVNPPINNDIVHNTRNNNNIIT